MTGAAPGRDATSGERAAEGPDGRGGAGDDGLATQLRIAVMRLTRRLRAEKSDDTLTLTQLSALSTVAGRGPLSPTALAELERVQPPSMTRVIARLEQLGLVVRAPHESDRRQSVIAISAAGTQRIEADRQLRDVWLAHALERLPPEDRTRLREIVPLLDRLTQS